PRPPAPPPFPYTTLFRSGPPLAHLLVGDRHGRELAQDVDLGQPQGVVAVGLALEVLELPGLGGGVGDQAGDAERDAQVAGPAGRSEEHTSELQSLAYLVC